MAIKPERTITPMPSGQWQVAQLVRIPHHEPFADDDRDKLTGECKKVCVPPVHAQCEGTFGLVTRVKLYADFPSEKESRSQQTADVFDRSYSKVIGLLRCRLPTGKTVPGSDYDKPTYIVEIKKDVTAEGFPTIVLHYVPVRTAKDFTCSSDGLLSYEQIKKISLQIDDGACVGQVDGIRWVAGEE
jgi:hypothetical protein